MIYVTKTGSNDLEGLGLLDLNLGLFHSLLLYIWDKKLFSTHCSCSVYGQALAKTPDAPGRISVSKNWVTIAFYSVIICMCSIFPLGWLSTSWNDEEELTAMLQCQGRSIEINLHSSLYMYIDKWTCKYTEEKL